MTEIFPIARLGIMRFISYLLLFSCLTGCGNYPPFKGEIIVEPLLPVVGQETYLRCETSDADGDVLSYYWEISGGQPTTAWGRSIGWQAPEKQGTYDVKLWISDNDRTVLTRTQLVVAKGTIVYGLIMENTTWTKEDGPYVIFKDTVLIPGVELVIEPGTEVVFIPNYNEKAEDNWAWLGILEFITLGKLTAVGTEQEPIIFTSLEGENPVPGSWGSLDIHNSDSRMEYCVLEYGDYGVFCVGASPEIRSCLMRKIKFTALVCKNANEYTGSSPLVEWTKINECGVGIYCGTDFWQAQERSSPQLISCNITNSLGYDETEEFERIGYAVEYGGFLDGCYLAGNNGAGEDDADLSLGEMVEEDEDGYIIQRYTSDSDPPQYHLVDGVTNPQSEKVPEADWYSLASLARRLSPPGRDFSRTGEAMETGSEGKKKSLSLYPFDKLERMVRKLDRQLSKTGSGNE